MTTFYKIDQHFYCYVYINPFPNLLEILNDKLVCFYIYLKVLYNSVVTF